MKKYTWFDILQWVIAALAFIGMAAIYILVFWEKIKSRVERLINSIWFGHMFRDKGE